MPDTITIDLSEVPESQVFTVDLSKCPEIADAVARLKEAYKGFPWCTCEDHSEALRDSVYFTHAHGVNHGWQCITCHGVTQVG